MIFAELQYQRHYSEVHGPLVDLLRRHFPDIGSGLQGDSYVWVTDGAHRVAVDTFTSMHHQVKSQGASALVDRVLEVLRHAYPLRILDPPAAE